MSAEDSHDSSIPPPPPRSERMLSAERVAESAELGRQRSKDALELAGAAKAAASSALSGVERIERAIGRSPDPAQGIEGSGMLLGFSRVLARLDAREQTDAQAAAIAKAEASKTERWNGVFRGLVLLLGAAGTVFTLWKGWRG